MVPHSAEVASGREELERSEGLRLELQARATQLREELQAAQERLGRVSRQDLDLDLNLGGAGEARQGEQAESRSRSIYRSRRRRRGSAR